MTQRVLVTGASGLVGSALCKRLFRAGYRVRAAIRRPHPRLAAWGVEEVFVGGIDGGTDWRAALADVDLVVHLAARVHVMGDQTHEMQAEYRRVNVDGTRALARAAVEHGVRRLVFMSSIKVNGEQSLERPLVETDPVAPVDPYGQSKWEAEQALHEIARTSRLEVVAVRPPLVYGPGVKANFLRMMEAVDRRLPLPLGAVSNRRSVVYVENLVDAVVAMLEHPAAVGETFFVTDERAVATPELVRGLGRALGRPAILLPVPARLLSVVGAILGKGAAVNRLIGSLELSRDKACRMLGWTPPFSLEEGLAATAGWYRASTERAG